MVNLTSFLISSEPELTNWIGKLIYALYNGIGNFGWTVVVFTIILKVILSPLDIWQKRTMLAADAHAAVASSLIVIDVTSSGCSST